MDSFISSALEEICFHGQVGISLSSLCTKIGTPPSVKPSLWKNLLSIPVLRFKAPNAEFLNPTDASIQCAEVAEKLDIVILAHETLRNNFVGLYDDNVQISSQQRRTLERLAIARANGVTQSQLAKEFGIEGKNFFYILKNLECRGLILKHPAVVRKKEHCSEGESKNSSPVVTNLIYLHRYAKRLGSQQRFEINEDEQTVGSLGYDDENVPVDDGFALENTEDNVLVNDYLPAMKAVCDKLEEANGKVLVVSDIKRDLGYTRSSGHRAWRNISRRLKDAGLVEELHAVVNEKAEICLRLWKRFPGKNLEPKLLGCDDHLNKGQQMKFGRSILNVDQIVELPIDNQIYDMVDSEESEGLPVMKVCERLGIDKKKSYSRFFNMFSRFGMHLQAESHKRTTAYRVWTSGNSYCKSSNAFFIIPKDADDEKQISSPDHGHSEAPDESEQNLIEYNPSTSAVSSFAPVRVNDIENATEISCGSPGETNHIVLYSDNTQRLPENSNTAQGAELDSVIMESQICSSQPQPIGLDLLRPSDSSSYQTYSSQVQTADGARREQRILGRLQEEKFILRGELYRWLVEFEKDKGTKMDRKTVDRLLKKLQQQGRCKCVHINVPIVTNCGRSRITQVVLHPSVEALHQELISEIHDRLRSFEMQIRGHGTSKLKRNESIPVLDGVQRTQGHVDSDAKAAKSEAMRANGFVLAKMVRSKLLHRFLWGSLSSFHGWDDLSLEKHLYDQKNLHGSCILFSLEAAIKAIPLELFSQVVGTTLKFDDMIEKCNKGFCLSDLHIEEYKLLMDTQATVRLSLLIDILRRLKVLNSQKRIGAARLQNGLYIISGAHPFHLSNSPTLFTTFSNNDSIMLWHNRSGHPSFHYLAKLHPSLFINKKPGSFHCDVCSLAKHTKKLYLPSQYKPSHPFSLIHSDIWGPSRVQNANHCKWFITFIDDHTRLTWTFLMREKSDTTTIFENFYNMVLTQFHTRIQQFHSDNGREYFAKSLGNFFQKHGIVQLSSCVDTPQQNGIAKRKNRHLLEVTQALLFTTHVPHYLWGEALFTATYLINRMPSKILAFKSPQSLFLEYYPSLKPISSILPLKIFGYTTFIQNCQPNKSKLSPRAIKCVFVGYSSRNKGY